MQDIYPLKIGLSYTLVSNTYPEEHDMTIAKIIIGEFELPLTEEHLENFISDLEEGNYAEVLDYIAKNTIQTNLIRRIIYNDSVSDETISFLLENRSSDLCLWADVITTRKVKKIIKEDTLIEFMKKSDSISCDVAREIEEYENCDAVKLSMWIHDNSSESTIRRLAANRSAPKKVLKMLSKHENKIISAVANGSLQSY